MAVWEYKVISSGKGGFATPALLESFLNQLGTDEWEIIEFRGQPDNPLAFSGLARRPTQRDWTLEDAAAAAARAEADKLRARSSRPSSRAPTAAVRPRRREAEEAAATRARRGRRPEAACATPSATRIPTPRDDAARTSGTSWRRGRAADLLRGHAARTCAATSAARASRSASTTLPRNGTSRRRTSSARSRSAASRSPRTRTRRSPMSSTTATSTG